MAQISDDTIKKLKEEIPKKVGLQIRDFRKKSGLSQSNLAHLVGKDRQYIYKIEKGIVTPNISTISIICLALEIELSDLFDFESSHLL